MQHYSRMLRFSTINRCQVCLNKFLNDWNGVCFLFQVKEEILGHESLQIQAAAANIVSS